MDEFGDCLMERLAGDGVDCRYVLREGAVSTGCAFAAYASDGSRRFIFHIGNTPAAAAKAPEGAAFDGAAFFHIMGCSLAADYGFGSEIVKAMHRAIEKGARVSFDPNVRPELMRDERCAALVKEVVAHSSVLLPGLQELRMVAEKESMAASVEQLFVNPVLELIAMKNGSKGCEIFARDAHIQMGVYPVTPVDPTGAGDCFDGAFLCALLENRPLEEAARMASAAAAINTAAFGPMEGRATRAAIDAMMRTADM